QRRQTWARTSYVVIQLPSGLNRRGLPTSPCLKSVPPQWRQVSGELLSSISTSESWDRSEGRVQSSRSSPDLLRDVQQSHRLAVPPDATAVPSELKATESTELV